MSLQARRIVDPVATEVVHGYDQANSIADFVAPVVTVNLRAGKIVKFGRENFAVRNTIRNPGDTFKRERLNYENDSYYIHQHARAAEVAREDYEEANEAVRVDLRAEAINLVNERIYQSWEKEVVDGITDTAAYETSLSIDITALPWTNSRSDPEADVIAAKELVRAQIGSYPTRAVVAPDVFNALKLHPKFQDRIKYTTPGAVNEDLIAQWFGLPGGIRVAERVFLDETVNPPILRDFMQGQMVLFLSPEDSRSGSFARNNGAGVFLNKNANSKARPSFAYTYSLSGYPVATPERFDEDNETYVTKVIFEQRFVPTGIGATGLIGAGALIYNAA